MRYHIWTVGCQMNKADSERIANALEGLGLVPVENKEAADVIVINSCSVRQSAEERVLSRLGALKTIKKERSDLVVALAGCMVGSNTSDLRQKLPFVDVFLKPLEVDDLLRLVLDRKPGVGDAAALASSSTSEVGFEKVEHGEECGEEMSPQNDELSPVRWVPIIYGCDNFCSYCIVPFRRGRERSRPPQEIVEEVRRLVASGAREVTLLGQNVDSYGHDLADRPDLGDLLELVNGVAGLHRVRFLTSHPKDMSEKLIDTVARLPKVCEYVNLPVQSGDDGILRAMKRGYAVDEYRALANRIRRGIPNVSLTTDLIVGFPGETREQFENSYRLLEELRFDVVHVAAYSPRPGTAAARLADDVPPEEKKRRLQQVEALQERIAAENAKAMLDTIVEVLVEGKKKGKWQGRTRTNKLVFFKDDRPWLGKLASVRVDKASAWSSQGTVIN
ncbi:MAG: tRNA (N6-isopentenyl adenosine(37)-C2)-methylthiotransferase MiaB [Chloroflexi bacterium]|nr:tRNA (N6-isopentenyl adenosine(37)-C2)-methylthiotransferase MiaB [Chloroflexota bacterium]